MSANDDDADDGEHEGEEGETFEEFYRDQRVAARHAQPDSMLQGLTYAVNENQGNFSFGVTLYVGGLIVCGDLIAASVWFNELAHVVDNAVGEQGKILSSWFRENGVGMQVSDAAPDELRVRPGDGPFWIHLRDAFVFQSLIGTIQHVYWRGRLSEVDAWSLGKSALTSLSEPQDR